MFLLRFITIERIVKLPVQQTNKSKRPKAVGQNMYLSKRKVAASDLLGSWVYQIWLHALQTPGT